MYSENYVYKDIKEKVIGLSLKYMPDLKIEFNSIIEDTILNKKLANELNEKKEKILEYMEKCDNNNIRIMKVWLINFERIYNVVEKNYGTNKFFQDVIDRFIRYSIRIACAIGKNKKLAEWEAGTEIGYINLDDEFLMENEGYRFVDDLYRNFIFDEIRICQTARYIEKEKLEEEKSNLESAKGKAYKELQRWIYLEDEELKKCLGDLKKEIEQGEFIPQGYQDIISLLVILKKEEYCTENDIIEVVNMLEEKINNFTEEFDIANFQHDSLEGLLNEYHKYYDPLYTKMMQKNNHKEKNSIEQILDNKDGKKFWEYCKKNHNIFFSKGAFASLIDLDKLKGLIANESIEGIYNIKYGFKNVYNFSNLYEFYYNDLEMLKKIKAMIEEMSIEGKNRKRAIQNLINELERVIQAIENKIE